MSSFAFRFCTTVTTREEHRTEVFTCLWDASLSTIALLLSLVSLLWTIFEEASCSGFFFLSTFLGDFSCSKVTLLMWFREFLRAAQSFCGTWHLWQTSGPEGQYKQLWQSGVRVTSSAWPCGCLYALPMNGNPGQDSISFFRASSGMWSSKVMRSLKSCGIQIDRPAETSLVFPFQNVTRTPLLSKARVLEVLKLLHNLIQTFLLKWT